MTNVRKAFRLTAPAIGYGGITGVVTALVILLYKWCAKYAIAAAEIGYHFLREHWWCVPFAVAVLGGVAWLLSRVYRRQPNLRGGGIPTSIGLLRGQLSFQWAITCVGAFGLSLLSFLIGLPLGNEGPSVQIGTALGCGCSRAAKRGAAWDRYAMTGGACAGFSVATGAPISGMLFAVEEAHRRVSPTIFITVCSSVACAALINEALSPLFGVSAALFPPLELPALSVRQLWLPLAIGVAFGLFAVTFLRYYQMLRRLFQSTLKRVNLAWKLWGVLCATLLVGLVSFSGVSTGHELTLSLLEGRTALWALAALLLVRVTLTLSANVNHLTGGIFLPLLAIGALFAALLGEGVARIPMLGEAYYPVVLMLGITACIAGMMRMPLTAVAFAVEALSGYHHILYVILTAGAAFAVTELFGAESINDSVLEHRVASNNKRGVRRQIAAVVTVQEGAFAVGRNVRDILWPNGLFVLSVSSKETGYGGLCAGDELQVHYPADDTDAAKRALLALVGDQDYEETEIKE
jgi:H+/Cl- antiporter ClcA